MKIIDIIIIIVMAFLLGASVYFNFIFPKKVEKEKLERLSSQKQERAKK